MGNLHLHLPISICHPYRKSLKNSGITITGFFLSEAIYLAFKTWRREVDIASQFSYQGKNEHLLKMGLQHHGVMACFQILLVTLSEYEQINYFPYPLNVFPQGQSMEVN